MESLPLEIKTHCVGINCGNPLVMTKERYEVVGNYCDNCIAKINANLRTKAAEQRYIESLRAVRGDDSGLED